MRGLALNTGKDGEEVDFEKALMMYEAGAEKGGARCQCVAGWMLLHGEMVCYDEEKGKKYIEASAAQGNGNAEYLLGMMYKKGIFGYPKDKERANTLLKQSAAHGFPLAIEMAQSL